MAVGYLFIRTISCWTGWLSFHSHGWWRESNAVEEQAAGSGHANCASVQAPEQASTISAVDWKSKQPVCLLSDTSNQDDLGA